MTTMEGTIYWTARAPDIVKSGREEQDSDFVYILCTVLLPSALWGPYMGIPP
jgi:hypothetical protein